RVPRRAVAALGEEKAGPDSDRQTDEAGQSDEQQRAEDRVADAASGLAHRAGQGGEQRPGQCREAFGKKQPENRDEGYQGKDDRAGTHAGHRQIHHATPKISAHTAAFTEPLVTARTRSRATELRRKVIPKRIRAKAARTPVCTVLVASANSLAITAGSE